MEAGRGALTPPAVVVVMGVSGSGKTTIGRALATRLAVPFEDGDDLHPAANVAKMAAGHPLDDADRAPWLAEVGAWIDRHSATGGVVACSALKRRYRAELLRPFVRFLYLDVPGEELRRRLRARTGHFMSVALLDSQLADLEPPGPDEPAVTVADGSGDPDAVVTSALAALRPAAHQDRSHR